MHTLKDNYYDLDKDSTIGDDYYDRLYLSKNPLRRWIHSSRYKIINSLVSNYYKIGSTIVDFGCGNCSWNINNLPVIGVDLSKRVIAFALRNKRLTKALCEDITCKTSLKENSANILVVSEVLEHLQNLEGTLREIRRVLKTGGILISSVPYDTIFSLWRPLFNFHSFIQGNLLKKPLFIYKVGHINRFNPNEVKGLYEAHSFKVMNQFHHYRLTIFTVGQSI